MSVVATTVADSITGSGTSISFNPSSTIPRTDPLNPTAGATILVLLAFAINGAGDVFTTDSVTDDTTPGSCISDDGSNKYVPSFWAGDNATGIWKCSAGGVIANDITSANTVTMNLATSGAPADFILLLARSYTGCNYPGVGPITDAAALNNHGSTVPIGGSNFVPPSSAVLNTQWSIDTMGGLTFSSPSGAGPSGWEWVAGEVAIYIAQKDSDGTTAAGAFTWDNPNLNDFAFDLSDVATGVGGVYLNFSWAEQPVTVNPDIGELVTGTWGGASVRTKGQGVILQGGNGLTCTTPSTGSPCFNNRIRLIA